MRKQVRREAWGLGRDEAVIIISRDTPQWLYSKVYSLHCGVGVKYCSNISGLVKVGITCTTTEAFHLVTIHTF